MHHMAQHKLRSRIAQFKQPFLVGAVTSAALLSGCGGEAQGTHLGTSDECPTQAPKSPQACDEYESGLDCVYDEESSCPREFRCNDGAWEDVSASCNPPPPDPLQECPTITPASGEACDQYEPGLDCDYDDESSCRREFICNADAWEDVSPSCNPPPPELECPEVAPAWGEACDEYEPGLDCAYDVESSCPREFTCNDGAWEGAFRTCNPPPPEFECPQVTPTSGEACHEYLPGLDCGYNDDSGCQREFTCNDGAWQDVSPTCNPPPPENECPEQPPNPGDSCERYELGLECESGVNQSSCPEASVVFCGSSGEWEGHVLICNPPPPELECPESAPTAGKDCETYEPGLECEYESGSCWLQVVCNVGTWADVSPTCNPPAVVESDAGVDGGVDPGVEVDAGVGVDAGEPDGG